MAATILIVDDDPIKREFLQLVLESEGYSLLEAKDGEEALTILRSIAVDLLITDLVMPGMDGYDLVRAIRADAILAPLKIISYSALYPYDDQVLLAKANGVQYVIAFPASPDDITRTVHQALSGLTGPITSNVAILVEQLERAVKSLKQLVTESTHHGPTAP